MEHDNAIDNFNKAIKLDPNIPEAYSNRELAKIALQNDTSAKAELQIVLQLAQQQENKGLADSIQKNIEALPVDSGS